VPIYYQSNPIHPNPNKAVRRILTSPGGMKGHQP
jgi:hypothetical protein